MRSVLALLIGGAVLATTASTRAQEIDWQKIDAAFGRQPTISGDVRRYGFPRTDLTVTLDGVILRPAFALGGWIAVKPARDGAMVMGDLVLLETEINPVMTKLIGNGIEITALNNHVLRGDPATFYMHVGGHGDPVKIAIAIREALTASRTPLDPPAAAADAPAIDLDTAQLDQIRPTAASTSSPSRAATRSPRMACPFRQPWGLALLSTSSRPAAAKPRSQATSS